MFLGADAAAAAAKKDASVSATASKSAASGGPAIGHSVMSESLPCS